MVKLHKVIQTKVNDLEVGMVMVKIINPQYNPILNDEGKYRTYNYINNFSINCTIKCQFQR